MADEKETASALTRRAFVANVYTDGRISWEDISDIGGRGLAQHSLTISVPLHGPSPRREVLRYVAEIFIQNRFDWFSLDGNRWRVDFDKLRAAFKLGAEFDWLSGSAFVEPDCDTFQDAVSFPRDGERQTELRTSVSLGFERDTLQQTFETDEERRGRIFDAMRFHPEVAGTCRSLFVSGHGDNAILQGCLRLNAVVQARTGSALDGDALFGSVFSGDPPQLKFTSCQTPDEKNEQAGFRFLFQGMAKAIRNPRAHRHVGVDEVAAIEHLAFLSMLLRFLDSAK